VWVWVLVGCEVGGWGVGGGLGGGCGGVVGGVGGGWGACGGGGRGVGGGVGGDYPRRTWRGRRFMSDGWTAWTTRMGIDCAAGLCRWGILFWLVFLFFLVWCLRQAE